MDRKEITRETYESIAPLYIEDFPNFVPLEDYLKKSISLLKKSGLLDETIVSLGAGPGNDAAFLLKSPIAKLVCVDFSYCFTKYMKKRFRDETRVEVVQEDIMDFISELKNDCIAMYVDSFTLMHIPEEEFDNLLDEIVRTLKVRGLLTTVCFEGEYKGMEAEPYQTDKDKRLASEKKLETYMNYQGYDELVNRMKEAGLTLVESDKLKPTGRVGDMTRPRIRSIFKK